VAGSKLRDLINSGVRGTKPYWFYTGAEFDNYDRA
jgi:hypothetical protein